MARPERPPALPEDALIGALMAAGAVIDEATRLLDDYVWALDVLREPGRWDAHALTSAQEMAPRIAGQREEALAALVRAAGSIAPAVARYREATT